MNEDNHQFDEADAQELPKLVAALKNLAREKVFVPHYVDDSILRAAHQHLLKRTPSRVGVLRRWFFWPAFASAAVVLVLFVLLQTRQPRYAREDLNHDGRADILDAFALAKELQKGAVTTANWDFNGDGVVDERDTALLAARSVQLEKGGRS